MDLAGGSHLESLISSQLAVDGLTHLSQDWLAIGWDKRDDWAKYFSWHFTAGQLGLIHIGLQDSQEQQEKDSTSLLQFSMIRASDKASPNSRGWETQKAKNKHDFLMKGAL